RFRASPLHDVHTRGLTLSCRSTDVTLRLQCHLSMTAEVGRSEVFRRRLAEFANQAERIHDGDVEALHRTRVASRRLRELLPVLEPDAVRKLGSRLRKVTQRLGVVRELDVLTIVIEELRRDDRIASAALQLVDDAVAERREAEQARLVEKLPAARL